MLEITEETQLINNLIDWTKLSEDDVSPHILFQKSEHTVEIIERYLTDGVLVNASKESTKVPSKSNYQVYFKHSVLLRDFAVLLRDTLLSTVKYEHYVHDGKPVKDDLLAEAKEVVKEAASYSHGQIADGKGTESEFKQYKHQKSPIPSVLKQLDELKIQLKKIYRSHDKVNEIRINLDAFKRDFQVQFQKQTGAVDELAENIKLIKAEITELYQEISKQKIETVIDQLNKVYTSLESMQSMESMDLLTYTSKNDLTIPIRIESGQLISKSLNVQSEVSKWFSANIYPHIIELENKRNLALERSLTALGKIRIKLSALLLDETESYDLSGSDMRSAVNKLMSDYIKPLKQESLENSENINAHNEEELFASSVYAVEDLFLPNTGSVLINNISRDAQKRMVRQIENTKKSTYVWLRDLLAKYVELDRTPFNAYISNKMISNKDDDRLSLFLKKGYLGKSFMVNRPALINPILSDYEHWKKGYAASVLLYGKTGSGKSALLGSFSQISLDEDVITINAGEPYITNSRLFEGSYDIKKAINNIVYQYVGKRVVLAIDDLSLWHSEEKHLLDNIYDLLELIRQYKGDVFFIVSTNQYLKERLENFRDLDMFFSSEIEVASMSRDDIREALIMRFKALPELGLTDTEHANTLGAITRNARGNVGHAMLEYCRFYADRYDPNLKSQDFIELVREYSTLLKYIACHKQVKVTSLGKHLNDLDYRELKENINYLAGNKILQYVKSNIVTINPFLVYSIENAIK